MSESPPPDSSDTLSDYVLRPPRSSWDDFKQWLASPFGLIVVSAVMATVALAVLAKPLYRAAKVRRVERMVAQIEEAHHRGDLAVETRLLREAVSLLPAHVQTWRARAIYLDRRGDPSALLAFQRLLGTEGATADDAEQACRLALQRAAADSCKDVLELVQKIHGAAERPAAIGLRARVLANERKLREAAPLAEKAASLDPDDHALQLSLASILLQNADVVEPSERAAMAKRAVRIMSELAKGTDGAAVQALQYLLQMAQMRAAAHLVEGYDVTAWTAAAERHPEAGSRLRKQAWDLLLASGKNDVPGFLETFVRKWQATPGSIQIEAARWLNQTGHARHALRLSEGHKESSEDWFILHLDALAASGQWSAVVEHLDKSEGQAATLPAVLRTLFRLKARAELGEPVDADEDWRVIMLQTQEAPVRTQVFVAQYAEKTGERKKAAAIYRRTLQSYSASASTMNSNLDRELKLACYTGFLRCTPKTAPAMDVLPVTEALVAEFREFEGTRAEVLYLRLLAGVLDEQTRTDVVKLSARARESLPIRTVVALLELRSGNPTAAEEAYVGLSADWGSAPDALKAVRAAVLTAAGKEDESQVLRSKIREQYLRPEELALLHPAPVLPPAEEAAGLGESAPAAPSGEAVR